MVITSHFRPEEALRHIIMHVMVASLSVLASDTKAQAFSTERQREKWRGKLSLLGSSCYFPGGVQPAHKVSSQVIQMALSTCILFSRA
jgi:hypothetical protein